MSWSVTAIGSTILMVSSGSVGTLFSKWADTEVSKNSIGHVTTFNHPFIQADAMFFGEFLCLLIYYTQRYHARRKSKHDQLSSDSENQKFSKLILYAPTMFDLIASCLSYMGLTLIYASSFQMLKGASIVFTGLLSVIFLNKRILVFQWIGIAFIVLGLILVSVSDIITEIQSEFNDMNSIILGDLLVIGAQIALSSQIVMEEKFIKKYDLSPSQTVGWEGCFGFFTLSFLLIPLYYIPAGSFSGNPRGVLEDAWDAMIQLSNNWILVASILVIVIIAFLNFAGMYLVKEQSGTTRTVMHPIQTVVIWIISVAVGWQDFFYLQLIGFLVLVMGIFLYNDVIILPFLKRRGCIHYEGLNNLGKESEENSK